MKKSKVKINRNKKSIRKKTLRNKKTRGGNPTKTYTTTGDNGINYSIPMSNSPSNTYTTRGSNGRNYKIPLESNYEQPLPATPYASLNPRHTIYAEPIIG